MVCPAVDFPAIHFGLETEVGITLDTEGEIDVVAESIALVRSARTAGVRMRWDYEMEDPHNDARGFRVQELRQDTDEAGYFAQDAQRTLTFTEIKSDLALSNGARFYNDHAHPEYCTPECANVDDLVLHDRAGERILMACAQELSKERGCEVRLYKNNTDFSGHSYGCHENYLIPRRLDWVELSRGIQAFLVTRQIFCGAGKFGYEEEDRFVGPGFQLSQRSDFFSELQSVDTMQRRPIINTRDEPHADPEVYRRFHVILGDANLAPFATRLKVGVTALVLEAIVRNPKANWPILKDPLKALRGLSRDVSLRGEVAVTGEKKQNGIQLQRRYLGIVESACDLSDAWKRSVVEDWKAVLDDLERDPMLCHDRLDWVAKFALVKAFQEREGIGDESPWLRSLDLEYSRIDLEQGLYYGLEAAGGMRGVPDERDVQRAVHEAPRTRAAVRGGVIQRFPDAVVAAQWDHVILKDDQGMFRIDLTRMFAPAVIESAMAVVQNATAPKDLRKLLNVPD